jgi:hypothetical protein
MRIIIAAFVSAIFVSACATEPIPFESARAIPQERILKPELTQKRDELIEVRFVRDQGHVCRFCTLKLSIESEPFAKIERGERLSIWVPAGIHTFSTIVDQNWLTLHSPRELEVDLKPDRIYRFRLGFTQDGVTIFELITH